MVALSGIKARGKTLAPALVALMAVAAMSGCSQGVEPERDASGSITATEANADVFSIKLGDCINDPEDPSEQTSTVEAVPCAEAHDNEVYFVFDLPDGDYLGASEVLSLAEERCEAEFENFIGTPYEESKYEYYPMYPTEASWGAGDQEVLCLVYHGELAKVTGSLEGVGA